MTAREILAGLLWSAIVLREDVDLLDEGWNDLADYLWLVTMRRV